MIQGGNGLPPDLRRFLDGVAPSLPLPALVFRRATIERNLAAALKLAGRPERLVPHLKTHKCGVLVRLQVGAGIRTFKVATLAEAEMAAAAGAVSVIVAFPLATPEVLAFQALRRLHENVRFEAIVDSERSASELADGAPGTGIWIDFDTGMGRTGIAPDDRGLRLATLVARQPRLRLAGFHVYDGHRAERDPAERTRAALLELEPVFRLRRELRREDLPLICGGTPSFPCYAGLDDPRVLCSPGIFLLHDGRYAASFPDLPFEPAAFVATRVISRPREGSFTIAAGSKSLCPDRPAGERARLFAAAEFSGSEGSMSEEHWSWNNGADSPPEIGTPLLLLPSHICPTVSLHREALVLDANGQIEDRWPIAARRHLSLGS